MRFACNKTDPKCKQCAECCKFRDKPVLTDDEDFNLREAMFNKSKEIYLFPMSRYTISLTETEKLILEKEADKQEIKLKILPKKSFYDEEKDKVYVLDYFLDYEICPFLKENKCNIYSLRPEVCKLFPLKSPNMKKDVDDFLTAHPVHNTLSFKESIKKVKEKLNPQSKSI